MSWRFSALSFSPFSIVFGGQWVVAEGLGGVSRVIYRRLNVGEVGLVGVVGDSGLLSAKV